jgi:hypothetical protein
MGIGEIRWPGIGQLWNADQAMVYSGLRVLRIIHQGVDMASLVPKSPTAPRLKVRHYSALKTLTDQRHYDRPLATG